MDCLAAPAVRRWSARAIVCSVALLVFAQAWASAEVIAPVTVDGVSAVVVDVGAARDAAIRDALRRAVEQVAGVAIEGRTLMVDFLVVEDRVVARAAGFIRSYEVVDERHEEDEYWVRVVAEVDRELLIDDLEGFGALLRLQLGNPRVVIVAQTPSLDLDVLGMLAEHFLERRFHVVSVEQIAALRAASDPLHEAEVVALARAHEAEVVVAAAARVDPLGVRPTSHGDIHSVRVTVSLQAILARTGQVIARQSAQATRANVSDAAATGDAAALAVEQAMDPFTLSTVQALNVSGGAEAATSSLRVVVHGIDDYRDVLRLRSLLQEVRGVASLQQREFSDGSASFDLQGSMTTDDLAVRLMEVADLPLRVQHVDAQRIEMVRTP